MANIGTSIAAWSTVEASNQPDGADSATIAGDLRAIQSGVRYLRSQDTIASATTCDLGTKSAESLTISGVTTITGLGTISAGIIKRVNFSGALTLTHNGTSLLLPGNANITTVAGDTAEFESLGSGNWRCNWYVRDSGQPLLLNSPPEIGGTTPNAATFTSINGGSLGGFRNVIIGGDFSTNPWQRGTTFTAPATNTYTADRWMVTHSSDGVVDVLKTADTPTAAQVGVYTQHCIHLDVTTADVTIGAAQYYLLRQYIEGYNVKHFGFGQSGTRYVTLSFWHKHTIAGTYCVAFRNSAGDRTYVAEYTQSVTDTWEKATITLAVDTSGTWLYDSGIGLRVQFAVAAGSDIITSANTWTAGAYGATSNQVNGLSSIANNFKIALVQLEAGSVATPFESRPIGTELALCQRYYEKSFLQATAPAQNVGAATGEFCFPQPVAASTGTYAVFIPFKTTKRTSPTTITLYNPNAANAQIRNQTTSADWSGSATENGTENGFSVTGTTPAATAVGQKCGIHWVVNSEL